MKKLVVILLSSLPSLIYACPGCMGAVKGGADDKTVYILGFFILFTYIPLYYLFKMIIKYKNINGTKIQ